MLRARMLAYVAHRLVERALEDVGATARPDTILGSSEALSQTRLTDRGFTDESVDRELMREQNGWLCKWRKRVRAGGYDRIVGALANPGNQPSKRRQEGKRDRCGVGSDRATC